MLKVGITGGIGSGKTTVCKIFATLGIPIYYSDDRAKALMVESQDLIQKIKTIFGESAYLSDGSLNRAHLAEVAFSNKEKLNQLNAAVHPAVFMDGNKWHFSQQEVPYTLKEAALIFEGGGHQFLDKIITVYAPQEIRLQRVLERDETNKKAVLARMHKQMPEEKKCELADFIIHNDGKQSLIQQVLEIHRTLIAIEKE